MLRARAHAVRWPYWVFEGSAQISHLLLLDFRYNWRVHFLYVARIVHFSFHHLKFQLCFCFFHLLPVLLLLLRPPVKLGFVLFWSFLRNFDHLLSPLQFSLLSLLGNHSVPLEHVLLKLFKVYWLVYFLDLVQDLLLPDRCILFSFQEFLFEFQVARLLHVWLDSPYKVLPDLFRFVFYQESLGLMCAHSLLDGRSSECGLHFAFAPLQLDRYELLLLCFSLLRLHLDLPVQKLESATFVVHRYLVQPHALFRQLLRVHF